MARIFKKKQTQEEASIDLTPMLDVVFIMLIFFIVTATFVSEEGFRLNTPPTDGDGSANGTTFVVTETNDIWLDGRQIDLRSVRANVERAIAENPSASVTVRAHELSTAEIYVGIADQATLAAGSHHNFAVNLVTYRN